MRGLHCAALGATARAAAGRGASRVGARRRLRGAQAARRIDVRMKAVRTQAALGAVLAAAIGIALAWGFTVDDALISARVAAHLAQGLGYRFNADGPRVDCVTPLG